MNVSLNRLRGARPADGSEVASSPAADYTFLDALVNGSPEALIAISPEGEILFWSAGAESIFGYTGAEAYHRSFFHLVVPPDRVRETRDALEEALRLGQASRESLRRRRDGSLVPVEVLMNVIRGSSGA
ncbi:MAG TPA: PAS domain-containing protein, partial [Bacteroidota bacterium]|nr:PAS domain-containing protein [Bacteroidota bacterium]